MWEVCKKTNCNENGLWCGQHTCELCELLAECWDKNAKGHFRGKLRFHGNNGQAGSYWEERADWREPNGKEVGGWWEWNFREAQKRKIRDFKKHEEVKQEISLEMNNGYKHKLWTIELKSDYNLEMMRKKLEELVINDKFKMGQSIAAYEYFSAEKPEGGNLHIHICVITHGTYKVGTQVTKLAEFWGIKENFIDYKHRKDRDLENAINYVLGEKATPAKRHFAEKDREWREKVKLPQFTSSLPDGLHKKFVKKFEKNQ